MKKLQAIVEMPKNTRYKYELDKDSNSLILDRIVQRNIPYNYGFILNTLAQDGDPLDVFIISNEPIPPLTRVSISILGGFDCLDKGVPDEKLIASIDSPNDAPMYRNHPISEIENYLKNYKDNFKIVKWLNDKEASKLIKRYSI